MSDAPGNRPKDQALVQDPQGHVYVVIGGAKFYFGSMTELASLGYSSSNITRVSQAPTDAIPSASANVSPAEGTLLRSGGGQIYIVAGGAKFHFGSMTEYLQQSVDGKDWLNAPQAPLDAIGDAPGNMPRNGTVVLRPDGALFVIAGGVRWQFGTMAEYHSLDTLGIGCLGVHSERRYAWSSGYPLRHSLREIFLLLQFFSWLQGP